MNYKFSEEECKKLKKLGKDEILINTLEEAMRKNNVSKNLVLNMVDLGWMFHEIIQLIELKEQKQLNKKAFDQMIDAYLKKGFFVVQRS